MNIRYLLLCVAAVVLCGLGFIFFKSENILLKNHSRERFSKNESEEIEGAMKWLSNRRVNQKTGRIDQADIDNALNQVKSLKNNSKTMDLQWSELGPDNFGGRTRAILIDKDNPNLIFAGSVSGGLWKTTTGGSSWQPVLYSGDANSTGLDGSDIVSTLAISSICQAANGDIYFGTGESYVESGGIINGNVSSGFDGQGIWKSTDRGLTFTRLTSTWNSPATQGIFRFVNKLAADPVNAQKIYAATYKGLMVTENGGSTWANYIPDEGDNETEDVKVGKKNGVVVVSMINGKHTSSFFSRTIFNENFNSTNSWTTINNSTGGTDPLLAAWTLRPDSFTYDATLIGTWHSNDNSQFYLSNSRASDTGVTTATILKSPSFSTVGYYAATLRFYHSFKKKVDTQSSAKVEYSIDGTTWINLKTFTSNVGINNTTGKFVAFIQENIELPAEALNVPSVYIRFKYDDTWGWFWAIDNVSVTGNVFSYIYVSSDGSNGSFVKRQVDNLYSGRQEIAVSPEDDNYIYCMKAKLDGNVRGIYKSTDKGVTWTTIGTQGTGFNILGTQGWYDNVIAVYPNNKEKIICGGQFNLYTYSPTSGWHAVSQWQVNQDESYVHADHHAIVFHPTNPDILYIGSDGGISKSSDGGESFVTLNKLYNVTQFYAVGFSGDGRVMGGTQDNGTLYNDYTGNTTKNFVEVRGGDGGYCEMSTLKPKVTFATTYNGSLGRSETPGTFIDNEYGPDATAAFVTPIALWESYNDSLSADSVTFKADRNYSAGELIHAKSKMNLRDLTYTLAAPLLKDSSIKVQDKFQSVLAIGMLNRVWITRKALDFTVNPAPWYPISKNSLAIGTVNTLAFSKDGNYIYFASDYNLYRCSNLNYARSATQMHADTSVGQCKIITQKIESFSAIGGFITSITVDPNNSENVVVTLGGYSNTGGKIWYSTNAASTTSLTGNFASKDNFVFPVYSSLLLWNDGKKVVIGSEYGIYSTDDITASTPVWNDQNNAMGNIPVFMLRQQIIPNTYITGVTNHGVIYAATHGRGLWKSESNKGPVGIEKTQIAPIIISNIMVYPNPAQINTHVLLELSKAADVTLNIYDLQGSLAKTLTLHNQGEGKHSYPINISELGKGNYILNAITGDNKVTTKFLVY